MQHFIETLATVSIYSYNLFVTSTTNNSVFDRALWNKNIGIIYWQKLIHRDEVEQWKHLAWPQTLSTQYLHHIFNICLPLGWRHNDHAGVSNHQPHGCLLNRLFRRRSKKTPKLRVTGLCAGNSPGPVNSPHKGPVTRKMFPFDDVIMTVNKSYQQQQNHKLAQKNGLITSTILI